jgi:hypothetical protein
LRVATTSRTIKKSSTNRPNPTSTAPTARPHPPGSRQAQDGRRADRQAIAVAAAVVPVVAVVAAVVPAAARDNLLTL